MLVADANVPRSREPRDAVGRASSAGEYGWQQGASHRENKKRGALCPSGCCGSMSTLGGREGCARRTGRCRPQVGSGQPSSAAVLKRPPRVSPPRPAPPTGAGTGTGKRCGAAAAAGACKRPQRGRATAKAAEGSSSSPPPHTEASGATVAAGGSGRETHGIMASRAHAPAQTDRRCVGRRQPGRRHTRAGRWEAGVAPGGARHPLRSWTRLTRPHRFARPPTWARATGVATDGK